MVVLVGNLHSYDIASVILCGNYIELCDSIKYLGIHVQSAKRVRFDINHCKWAFYVIQSFRLVATLS